MQRHVPAIRILPMSSQLPGFRGRSIADVQRRCFLRELPSNKGQWRYPSIGLNADPGTLVLFQFQARIIACAIFLRDEKYEKPIRGYGGSLHFDPESFCTFDPLDVDTMRTVWPGFRGFGHVRQKLNPALFSQFKRRLRNVASPRG